MPEFDLTINDGSKPLQYNANDWFYMKNSVGDVCESGKENDMCNKNKSAVTNLKTSTENLGASITQYNDAKMLYNRELLFMINILAGLMLICYYIYVNQSAVPSLASIMNSVKDTGSLMGRLSMSPGTSAAAVVAK